MGSEPYKLSQYVGMGRQVSAPRPGYITDASSPRNRWRQTQEDRAAALDTARGERNFTFSEVDISKAASASPRPPQTARPPEFNTSPKAYSNNRAERTERADERAIQRRAATATNRKMDGAEHTSALVMGNSNVEAPDPVLGPWLRHLPRLEQELEANLADDVGSSERIIRHQMLWYHPDTVANIHRSVRNPGSVAMPEFPAKFNRDPSTLAAHPVIDAMKQEQSPRAYQLAQAYNRPRTVGGAGFLKSMTRYNNNPDSVLCKIYSPGGSSTAGYLTDRQSPTAQAFMRSGKRDPRKSYIPKSSRTKENSKGIISSRLYETKHGSFLCSGNKTRIQKEEGDGREPSRSGSRLGYTDGRAGGMAGRDYWGVEYSDHYDHRAFTDNNQYLEYKLASEFGHEHEDAMLQSATHPVLVRLVPG